ncbi:MAG: hypothetical protein IJ316_00010 [Clostridia bacterium]|nr:hypothetical protein [Clostridia bacterium]
MQCKFCGNQLTLASKFCCNCGKKVKSNNEKSVSWKKDDALFLVALVLFFVISSVRFAGISYVFGLIGLGAVVILRVCGLIKPEKVKLGIWTFSIAILLLELYRIFGFWYVHRMASMFLGSDGILVTILTQSYGIPMEETWGANTLWLWGLLILFMLLKSESIKIRKSYTFIVLFALLTWSIWLDVAVINEINTYESHWHEYSVNWIRISCGGYILLMFLRRFVTYWFALFAGQGRIGNVRNILFAVFVVINNFLVTPFAFSVGVMYAEAVCLSWGYVIGMFILLTGFIKKKDKKKPMLDTPQNDLLTN